MTIVALRERSSLCAVPATHLGQHHPRATASTPWPGGLAGGPWRAGRNRPVQQHRKPWPHCYAYHSYADDTQIYLALSPNDYSPIDSLCQCIDEINSWMCQNFLQLNKEKTEVIAFGNKDEVLKVNAYLDSRGQTTKIKSEILG